MGHRQTEDKAPADRLWSSPGWSGHRLAWPQIPSLSTSPPQTLQHQQYPCCFQTRTVCTLSLCPLLYGNDHPGIWSLGHNKGLLFYEIVFFTTLQTLPFRVFTLRVPTLKFLRCLLDLPQWPDPAPHTWEGAKPETPLTEIWFLPASPNVTSFVDSAMIVFGTKVFLGSPVLADIPTQIYDGLWDSAVPALGECALPFFLYRVVRQATIARMPNHRCVDGCHLALPPRLWQPLNPEVGDAV